MKLSDAQLEETRARLRASNLDDLANAFQDESPLSESYDEMFDDSNRGYSGMSYTNTPTSSPPPRVEVPPVQLPVQSPVQLPVPTPQAAMYKQEIPIPQQQPSYRDDALESFLAPPKVSQASYRDDDLSAFLRPPEKKSIPEEKEIYVKPILKKVEEEKEEVEEVIEETKEEILPINETKQVTKMQDQEKKEAPVRERSRVHFSEPDPFNIPEDDEDEDEDDGEYDPFNFDGKQEEEQPYIFKEPERPSMMQERQQSRPVLVINGAELNSPKRRTCLATLLIVCAAIGFGISMSQPPTIPALKVTAPTPTDPCESNSLNTLPTDMKPTSTTVKCTEPTISPAPTKTHTPTQMPTVSKSPSAAPITLNIYDHTYSKIQTFLVDSEISTVAVLPPECYHSLCSRRIDPKKITMQQKVVHHLMTRDTIFFQWVSQNKLYDHTERAIQRYVLTLMAFTLDSKNWQNKSNWPFENGLVVSKSECDWFGLTCEDRSAYKRLKDFVDHTFLAKGSISGREVEVVKMVTRIVLRENMLNGELPQELFKLRHLEELKIHNNKISGTIPKTVALLSNLKKMWIHNTTHLSGTIPTTISNMTSLTSLWIGLNKIEGSIPKEVGNLNKLHTLGLLSNKIQGTIPPEIVKMKSLRKLYLDVNQLNGTIPQLLGQLSELMDLRLDNNQLSGTIPLSLSNLKKLETFYAYKNRLTGDISSNFVVGWERLEKLELFDNKLTGTISPYFGLLPNLVTLDLHDNQFNTTISSQLCASGTLTKLDLGNNNKIRGQIPNLSDCIRLTTLDLSNNAMTGMIPTYFLTMPFLKFLSLQGNDLVTPPPKGLCTQIETCNV